MPTNPYEPPQEVNQGDGAWRRPHWLGVALWSAIALVYVFLAFVSWSEYRHRGFVGGDGLSAVTKWSFNLFVLGVLFPFSLYRLWLAARWFPPH